MSLPSSRLLVQWTGFKAQFAPKSIVLYQIDTNRQTDRQTVGTEPPPSSGLYAGANRREHRGTFAGRLRGSFPKTRFASEVMPDGWVLQMAWGDDGSCHVREWEEMKEEEFNVVEHSTKIIG